MVIRRLVRITPLLLILLGCTSVVDFPKERFVCTRFGIGAFEHLLYERRQYSNDFSREKVHALSVVRFGENVVWAYTFENNEHGERRGNEVSPDHPSILEIINFCDKEDGEDWEDFEEKPPSQEMRVQKASAKS